MQELVSIKVNEETLKKMRKFYFSSLIQNDGEYIYFCAKISGLVITGYSGKKAQKTVTFLGDGALHEAKIWDESAELYKSKEKVVGEIFTKKEIIKGSKRLLKQ